MSESKDKPFPDFVTLGMFIIDKIHFPTEDKTVDDIIGGAGTFGIVGARLFSPSPKLAKYLGWIVDAGSDFPEAIREELLSWDTDLIIRETPERLTTRAINTYGPGDHRAFQYLTPKIRLEPKDFLDTPLINSESFHTVCSPERCAAIVSEIHSLRTSHIPPPPIIIWEPIPDLCLPEHLAACLESLRLVDVVSPNAGELGAWYGIPEEEAERKEIVEENAEKWFTAGVGKDGNGPVVVRAGKEGCFIRFEGGKKWLPAVWGEKDEGTVVDPTGGGNSFIGGFAVGLVRTGDVLKAAAYGNVAASFAIEQIGMPKLTRENGEESWNGHDPYDRLFDYIAKVGL